MKKYLFLQVLVFSLQILISHLVGQSPIKQRVPQNVILRKEWFESASTKRGDIIESVILQTDNDIFSFGLNNDEDFTTGINLHFCYKTFFKKSIFPSFGASEDWQLGRTVTNSNIMGFGSLLYTPKNLEQKSVIDTMDRPFASFQYLTIGRSSVLKMWNPWLDKKNYYQRLDSRLDLGAMGGKYGQSVQTWMHQLIDDEKPFGWKYQIGGRKTLLTFNYNFQYEALIRSARLKPLHRTHLFNGLSRYASYNPAYFFFVGSLNIGNILNYASLGFRVNLFNFNTHHKYTLQYRNETNLAYPGSNLSKKKVKKYKGLRKDYLHPFKSTQDNLYSQLMDWYIHHSIPPVFDDEHSLESSLRNFLILSTRDPLEHNNALGKYDSKKIDSAYNKLITILDDLLINITNSIKEQKVDDSIISIIRGQYGEIIDHYESQLHSKDAQYIFDLHINPDWMDNDLLLLQGVYQLLIQYKKTLLNSKDNPIYYLDPHPKYFTSRFNFSFYLRSDLKVALYNGYIQGPLFHNVNHAHKLANIQPFIPMFRAGIQTRLGHFLDLELEYIVRYREVFNYQYYFENTIYQKLDNLKNWHNYATIRVILNPNTFFEMGRQKKIYNTVEKMAKSLK